MREIDYDCDVDDFVYSFDADSHQLSAPCIRLAFVKNNSTNVLGILFVEFNVNATILHDN